MGRKSRAKAVRRSATRALEAQQSEPVCAWPKSRVRPAFAGECVRDVGDLFIDLRCETPTGSAFLRAWGDAKVTEWLAITGMLSAGGIGGWR